MNESRLTCPRFAVIVAVVVALLGIGLALPQANAAGPPYSGPVTQSTGPAYFGPAPNPFPYCENPTYFDPFPENVNPIGRIDVTGAPNASVTTDGITMTFELTEEGDPGGQYPGFFPQGGDGGDGDQPKGVEMASDDAAIITLSEPLFYTQWVFTDVDRANEGFFVTPLWDGAAGQVAVFGGDPNFDFAGTTTTTAVFNDTDTVSQDSEAIEGRVQVDLLGAASGISILRDTGSGQSGFAVGGGCEPIGVAKEVTSGPTWNGTSYDVTYTIRVRNNLPSAATIGADIAAAQAAAASSTTTGDPIGINMTQVTLTDLLTDSAFSAVTVLSNTNTSGDVETNPGFDGDGDVNLLAAGETILPESEEEFVVAVQYVPDAAGALGPTCAQPYQLLNSATVGGVADGVGVVDLSDNGVDPDPGVDNGGGGNDDPTPVDFDCAPAQAASLEIVKTVVTGPGGTCPDFAGGQAGDGPALDVTVGDVVTYCISVLNSGSVDLDAVVITDLQAPATFDGTVGALAAGTEATRFFDLTVEETTPPQNTATANGNDPAGEPIGPVIDTAVINPLQPAVQPAISLTKTVLAGAGADCSTAVEGSNEFVLGVPGDPITWCFVVTNTGDVSLTNVTFDDAPASIAGRDLLVGTASPVLAIADSIAFSLSSTIPATGVDNVASVGGDAANDDGSPIAGVPTVTDENTASVGAAALELAKTVAAGDGADCAAATEMVAVNVGSPVTYCFTITNTGSVTVQVTQVDDVTLGITVAVPVADQDIAAGASVQVAHSTIATGDLVNTARVTGVPIDPNGDPYPNPPVLEPEDPAEVDTLQADLSLVKSNNRFSEVSPGQRVPYTLEIVNAGPDAAAGVVVVDVLPAGLTLSAVPTIADWSCSQAGKTLTCEKATDLAVGETVALDYFVVVDVLAPANTPLVNTASVSADTPDPDPTDNEDTETTQIRPPAPAPNPDEPLGIVIINNPPPNPGAPQPIPAPAPPAAPLTPLAVTGSVHSGWLIFASSAMTALGASFFVAGRRWSHQDVN